MNRQRKLPKKHSGKRGGSFFPALCNVLGTLILCSVILACLPVTLPKVMGYEIYNVVSGSMEPELPVGSVVYVEAVEPEDIQAEDIIAFQSGESVITHRVVRNQTVEGEFTTKGDANAEADRNAVPYEMLIGKVVLHLPVLGAILAILTSTLGKLYVLCYAACGAMLHILAGRMRDRTLRALEQELRDSHGVIDQKPRYRKDERE